VVDGGGWWMVVGEGVEVENIEKDKKMRLVVYCTGLLREEQKCNS